MLSSFGHASHEVNAKLFLHIFAEDDEEEASEHDLEQLSQEFASKIPEVSTPNTCAKVLY